MKFWLLWKFVCISHINWKWLWLKYLGPVLRAEEWLNCFVHTLCVCWSSNETDSNALEDLQFGAGRQFCFDFDFEPKCLNLDWFQWPGIYTKFQSHASKLYPISLVDLRSVFSSLKCLFLKHWTMISLSSNQNVQMDFVFRCILAWHKLQTWVKNVCVLFKKVCKLDWIASVGPFGSRPLILQSQN